MSFALEQQIEDLKKEIESLKDMLAYEQTYVESIESRLEVAENLLHNYTVIDCGDVWETTLRAREFLKQRELECVCDETSSRNCPVHQNNHEPEYKGACFACEVVGEKNLELEAIIDDLLDVLEVNQKHHPTQTKAELIAKYRTTCKDCGTETKRGKGSARCPSCWEDRCGYSTDNEE